MNFFIASPVHAADIEWPGDIDSIAELVTRILPYVYGIAGVALFAMLIYGGFMWLTSAGDPEKVSKGVGTIVNAVIGIAIVAFAYVATLVVGNILGFELI